MKTKELRQKPKEEMKRIVLESKEKLRQLRFDLASGKVKNVREMHRLKKDIAKILTILKES